MKLTPVAPGDYLTPADRMCRIRETRTALGDSALFDPFKVWAGFGVLAIPGLDEAPQWVRYDRAAVRRHIAREDWKERCKRKRRVPARVRRIVIEQAGSRCEYCGQRLPAAKLEIDHVLPVTRGGRSYFRNLAAACGECNWSKFDQLVEEWLPQHQARLFGAKLQAVREIFGPDAFKPRLAS